MKKSSKRLVYVLSTNNSNTGHSLGVNSLAVDSTAENGYDGTLYTAGRDGIIHSWGLEGMQLTTNKDCTNPEPSTITTCTTQPDNNKNKGQSVPLQKEQIHTNWVNDIVMVNNRCVASCSSDLTVKLWNPHTNDQQLIGQHRDYVKCLASPSTKADWVVSGGLDRRLIAWDYKKQSEKFTINMGDNDDPKASVYALDVNTNGLIASGGPDSVVRLYDHRTANDDKLMRFVGHNDNIRAVMISNDGKWVLSGSSDSTVKLWSVAASRLMHTFDMHDDSVWSLFSNNRESLDVFYSADRSGLVCKTDLRGCDDKMEIDEGVCSVVCNEHQGVSKIVSAGDYIWTASSNSCVHRWNDIDTTGYAYNLKNKLQPVAKLPDSDKDNHNNEAETNNTSATASNSSSLRSVAVNFLKLEGGPSLDFMDRNVNVRVHQDEDDTIFIDEDLYKIRVEPLQKNPIETLEGHIGLIKHRLLIDRKRVLTLDTAGEIKLWDLMKCTTLQSFGSEHDIDDLADQLNALNQKAASISNWCQVATRTGELYVTLEEGSCFDAEVYADEQDGLDPALIVKEDHRINIGRWVIRNLLENLITVEMEKDKDRKKQRKKILMNESNSQTSLSTVSTVASSTNNSSKKTTADEWDGIQKVAVAVTPATTVAEEHTEPKSTKSKFMGKLRGFGKNKKEKQQSSSTNGNGTNNDKPTTSVSNTNTTQTKPQLSMKQYIEQLKSAAENTLSSAFTPPPPEDAPPLGIPPNIKLMLSEQTATAGGTMDLYRGTVSTVGQDAEQFEKVAPEWLARVIFKNELPSKEGTKIGFTLQPMDGEVGLPLLAGGQPNLRLTAYQMLRVRKILIYLVDRLDSDKYTTDNFELLCQGKVVTWEMSLASIRTKIWRSGGDVLLKYRFKK